MILWYSLTLFVSASLLFFVQPMVGKMVLPLYGGTSAVWNTCMVFFQSMLLLGYAYAHISVRWLGGRLQACAHVVVLLAPIAVLPILNIQEGVPPSGSHPVYWLLRNLLSTVGLPVFVLSSSAPLLQRWFSETSHPSSNDPYFLYASSNAGSLIGLLGYPIFVEPLMSLNEQSRVWDSGYGALIIMIVICGSYLWRLRRPQNGEGNGSGFREAIQQADRITARQRLFWICAAGVPSSLLLSVTLYITTNIAAVPFLWVMPLALYLLTFILAFARKQLLSHRIMVRIMPFIIIPLAPFLFFTIKGTGLLFVLIHLLLFFVTAMVSHGELAKSRPSAQHLTEFYFLISLGGVLGGLFNTLVAPVIFNQVIEYPIVIFLACFILPQLHTDQNSTRQRGLDVICPLLIAAFNSLIYLIADALDFGPGLLLLSLLFAPSALVCFSFKERPVRFALAFGVLLISLAFYSKLTTGEQLFVSRNFFGVKQVVLKRERDIRFLMHGTIIHGSQFADPARHGEPLSYYHKSGPMGDVFAEFNHLSLKRNVAIVGLGVGSIAGYLKPGHHFVFYEIDPDVGLIARNRDFFTFLSDSKGSFDIVLGDGRLSIANAPERSYGMIILDAFSSDAIPVHLLTKEALMLYVSKLEEKGVIVFHITNSYLNLEPLLANLAEELGLKCLVKHDTMGEREGRYRGKYPSDYVVAGKFDPLTEELFIKAGWQKARTGRNKVIWTDRYSNIVSLLKW